jgi:acyl-CoA thioester hydrolase
MKEYTLQLTATPDAIDELGHVNNAVWVQWIQQVATGHWDAAAPQSHKDAYIWVVVRHEIDYLRARTVWALLDKASGRPLRVTDAIVAPFLA